MSNNEAATIPEAPCSYRTSARIVLYCGLLLFVMSGCRHERGASPVKDHEGAWFREVAREAGVHVVHVRGMPDAFYFPEIMVGGAAWIDYDNDADLDLYIVQSGTLTPRRGEIPGNVLYENQGNGVFYEVTETAGVGDAGYGAGVAVGDYDMNGYLDLYVTNVGANVLYRNNGDGSFSDVTQIAGVGHEGWGSSTAFFDYDADGDLDLYVVNYVIWSRGKDKVCQSGSKRDYCGPQSYRPAHDVLYRNEGDGTFTDVSVSSGIATAEGAGLGLAPADFDNDGLLDVYVTNDGLPNQLWQNRGDGTFKDIGVSSGTAVNRQGAPEAGMGVTVFDRQHDGDLDLLLAHLRNETHTLYQNEGAYFQDATITSGLSVPGLPYTGFGIGAIDFDHDGLLDVYIANGAVKLPVEKPPKDVYGEPNHLFRGHPDGRFEEVEPRGGTVSAYAATSRAAAFGDYDNDGDVDMAVVNSDGPLHLFSNETDDRGQWIQCRVLDRWGLDSIGAKLRIRYGDRVVWRSVQVAYSYLASNDPRVHVGLDSVDTVAEIEVSWPGRDRETFGPFAARQVVTLSEGKGRSVRSP